MDCEVANHPARARESRLRVSLSLENLLVGCGQPLLTPKIDIPGDSATASDGFPCLVFCWNLLSFAKSDFRLHLSLSGNDRCHPFLVGWVGSPE